MQVVDFVAVIMLWDTVLSQRILEFLRAQPGEFRRLIQRQLAAGIKTQRQSLLNVMLGHSGQLGL